jgi:group I intron endonuclease
MAKKKNPGIIYKSTNTIDGKIYIGLTTNSLKNRIRQHRYGKAYFSRAINKYGENQFKWEVIESEIPYDKLRDREKYYIRLFNSNDSKYGYNLTDGGDGNLKGNRKKRPKIDFNTPSTLCEYLEFIDLIKINKPQIIDEYKSIIEDKIKMLCLV